MTEVPSPGFSATPTPAVEDRPRPLPLAARAINTFFAPGKVGENLRHHRLWLAPFLTCVILSGVVGIPMIVTERGRAISREQMEKGLKKAEEQGQPAMSDEQKEFWLKATGAFGLAAGGFVMAATVFIGAGILWLIFTLAMGRDGRYMQYVSVLSHIGFIMILAGAVRIGLQLSSGSLYSDANLTIFFPDLKITDPLFIALTFANIFTFWTILATGTMVGGLTRQSAAKGIVALFITYLVFSAVMFPIALFFICMQE